MCAHERGHLLAEKSFELFEVVHVQAGWCMHVCVLIAVKKHTHTHTPRRCIRLWLFVNKTTYIGDVAVHVPTLLMSMCTCVLSACSVCNAISSGDCVMQYLSFDWVHAAAAAAAANGVYITKIHAAGQKPVWVIFRTTHTAGSAYGVAYHTLCLSS